MFEMQAWMVAEAHLVAGFSTCSVVMLSVRIWLHLQCTKRCTQSCALIGKRCVCHIVVGGAGEVRTSLQEDSERRLELGSEAKAKRASTATRVCGPRLHVRVDEDTGSFAIAAFRVRAYVHCSMATAKE